VPRRNSLRSENLRRALAQDAARIMAEHGIQDFLAAKRKAAARYGQVEAALLPSNSEIEAALVEYQRLFAGQSHDAGLRRQRSVALRIMTLMAPFQPRLVGPVLTGTATAYSDIQLHVFAERPEIVAFALMDRRIDHDITERKLRSHGEVTGVQPGLRFEFESYTFDVIIFPLDGIRQSPASPVDGRPMRRADAQEVELLLTAG
jgi:hypothetical protein